MNTNITVLWSTVTCQLHYMIVYYVVFSNAPCTNGRSGFLTNSTSSIKLEGSQSTIKLVFVLVIICCQYFSIFESDVICPNKGLAKDLTKINTCTQAEREARKY